MVGYDKQTYYAIPTVFMIGCVLGLSTGFLDISVNIVSEKPFGLSSFSFILLPLLTTVIFFSLTYLAIWFLILSHVGRLLKLRTVPLAASLALILVLFFVPSLLNKWIHIYSSPMGIIKLLIIFLITFLIFIGIYFVTKVVAQKTSYRNIAVGISTGIPFILAEAMIFIWLYRYKMELAGSMVTSFIYFGFIFILLFIFFLSYRLSQSAWALRLIILFTALVILSPFLSSLAKKGSRTLLYGVEDEDHSIKHVILITVDALRADAVSSYNHGHGVSTPHIDQLSKDGILFTKAISSAPWTLPSVASIMTGLPLSVHMTKERSSRLPDNLKTLAEYMRDAGYYTAAVGYSFFLNPDYNLSQGFFEYNFFPKSSIGNSLGIKLLRLLFPNSFLLDASTDELTRLAVSWLESNYKKNFFLWMHYFDPHVPYSPPPDFLPKEKPPRAIGTSFSKPESIRDGYFVPSLVEREWIRKLYEGEVRYVDENIGKLIDALKRLNLYDDSLIIFMSDHGEEFWEHGGYEHGHSLYNEVLWVPLIIKLPMSASRGQVGKVVSIQSIMPTILDLCGINYGGNYLSVHSLSPLWGSNPGNFNEQPIISTGLLYYEDRESVIFDGLKYIHFLVTNREELYDLKRDPGEQISIARSSPEEVERARAILRKHKEVAKKLVELYRTRYTEAVKLDKKAAQDLKALGYIQ